MGRGRLAMLLISCHFFAPSLSINVQRPNFIRSSAASAPAPVTLNDIRCTTLSAVIALYSYYHLSPIIEYLFGSLARSPCSVEIGAQYATQHSVSDHRESFSVSVAVAKMVRLFLIAVMTEGVRRAFVLTETVRRRCLYGCCCCA